MITDGLLEPMELAHLPYKKGRTYEDYVGRKGLKRVGKRKWRRHVADVVQRLRAALEPDDLVIGGGNAKKLAKLPPGARLGKNADAFVGGFRVWSSKTKPRAGRAVQVPRRISVAPECASTGAGATDDTTGIGGLPSPFPIELHLLRFHLRQRILAPEAQPSVARRPRIVPPELDQLRRELPLEHQVGDEVGLVLRFALGQLLQETPRHAKIARAEARRAARISRPPTRRCPARA